MSKGVSKALLVILIIVVLLLFLVIFVKMVSDDAGRKIELNLLSASVLRAENTFYLLNRSLGTTWYVSTVQTIFKAGDESIGCGYDRDQNKYVLGGFMPNDMKDGYWYQGGIGRKNLLAGDEYCKQVLPMATKYNNNPCNPMICAPKSTDIKKYLEDKISGRDEPEKSYQNIKKEFSVNDIQVNIDNINTVYSIENEKISSSTRQSLSLNDNLRTTIKNDIQNDATIYTQLNKMAKAGFYISKTLYGASLDFQNTGSDKRYKISDTSEAYIKDKKELIISEIMKFENEPLLKMNDAKTGVSIKKFEILGSTEEFRSKGLDSRERLILHYDAEVSMVEGAKLDETQASGDYDWPADSRRLTSCYGPRLHPVFGDSIFHMGIDIGPAVAGQNDNIKAAQDGNVVEVENGCDEGNKNCGSGYGNYVIIKHGDNSYTFYGHMEKSSVAVNVGDEVSKGQVMGRMGNTGISTGVHLHFEARSDIHGERIDPCKLIDCTQSELEECRSLTLRDDYEGYYYHYEDANTFDRRPVSLVFGVEDYLPILFCNPEEPLEVYTWKKTGDMLCCGGNLWVCCQDQACNNINIPGIEDEYKFYNGEKPQKWSNTDPCYKSSVSCQDGSFI